MRTPELQKVLDKLHEELDKIENKTIGGLFAGALLVQRDAQKHVPVEYGNLRASAYTRKKPEDPNVIEIGFTAAYALFVHENMEQKLKGKPRPSGLGVYWGPEGEPQFLTNALKRQSKNILKLAAKSGSVK